MTRTEQIEEALRRIEAHINDELPFNARDYEDEDAFFKIRLQPSDISAVLDSLAAPQDQERPLDEKHVQFATVSQPLMHALCAGEWRVGPIIFEAPGGHGSFSAWAILAPWPWLRDGKDTPHAAIARFLTACPPEPPGCSHHGPGCPDPQPFPPSAPPPVTPGVMMCVACAGRGLIDVAGRGVEVCVNCQGYGYCPPAAPPVTDAGPWTWGRCPVVDGPHHATAATPGDHPVCDRCGVERKEEVEQPTPVTDAGRCPECKGAGWNGSDVNPNTGQPILCDECGGTGETVCPGCNDGGVRGDGGDCSCLSKKPCPKCTGLSPGQDGRGRT